MMESKETVQSGSCPEVSGVVAVKKQMIGLWPAVATAKLQGAEHLAYVLVSGGRVQEGLEQKRVSRL